MREEIIIALGPGSRERIREGRVTTERPTQGPPEALWLCDSPGELDGTWRNRDAGAPVGRVVFEQPGGGAVRLPLKAVFSVPIRHAAVPAALEAKLL